MKPSFPPIVILAGGFGTRLKALVKDVPKPMAEIAGKPFLEWILHYYVPFKPQCFVLCTGYLHEVVEHYFKNEFRGIPIIYSRENEPLGTGGAIKLALTNTKAENVLVLNGDSFFKINPLGFLKFHRVNSSPFSIALKEMQSPARYGTVALNNLLIEKFREKDEKLASGLINSGVYLIQSDTLNYFPAYEKFSLEKDFMEPNLGQLPRYGYIDDGYFIDIGIPEDFIKANHEFKTLFN